MDDALFRARSLPVLQNRVFDSKDEALNSPVGDVRLVQDITTGIIYNAEFRPELIVYDQNYQNEQGFSGIFSDHLERVLEKIQPYVRDRRVIEIGCGKGRFLNLMISKGIDAFGIDPAYEGSDPRIRAEFFNESCDLRGDVVVLRHVLEHIPNPYNFLASIKETNKGGLIAIEVPSLEWIMEKNSWWDIFYEHVNYFRLSDFDAMFGKIHVKTTVFGGQYILILADLDTLRPPSIGISGRVRFPEDFSSRISRDIDRIKRACAEQSRPCVIWGAASKGVIFSLFMQRSGSAPNAVFDINPRKQGRYLACSGIRVDDPSSVAPKLPDKTVVFVMNGNYLPEIIDQTERRFQYMVAEDVNV